MRTLFSAAAIAASLAAAPALAQDAPAPDRTTGEANFTGLRVEGQLGYANTGIEVFDRDDFPELDEFDNDISSDGLLYGAGVGYDFAVGNFVVGVESSINWTTGESRLEFDDSTTGLKLDYGRDIEVGARVGGRIGQNTLLYVKGGYTNLKVNLRNADSVLDPGDLENIDFEDGGIAGTLDGWRLGGGVEFALPINVVGQSAFGKIEYRYSNYEGNVDRNSVVAGVGFRF